MHSPEDIKPYCDTEAKGKQVGEMFDSIAPAYDFMNTAMTGGLHRWWRNRALLMADTLMQSCPEKILDVACGTGDVAFRLHEMYPAAEITGLDLSEGMLEVARSKISKMDVAAKSRVRFVKGDSLAMPYPDGTFDLLTVAYGVRNFERLSEGLREMARVVRPGGVLCVVELSEPANPIIRAFYRLYTRNLIPAVGRLVSKDPRAYTYLPESIAACPQRGEMTRLMDEAGFKSTSFKSLTLGVVTIYLGVV